jgi:hypothetical protein
MFQKLFKQEVGTLWAFTFNDGGQGVHPFTGFLLVFVADCGAKVFRP